MTSSLTHSWRLLKWGRTLARHGALTGIEQDPMTPPRVKMIARIARFGTRTPAEPDYAKALQEIEAGERKLVGYRTTTDYRDLYPMALGVAAAAIAALWLFL